MGSVRLHEDRLPEPTPSRLRAESPLRLISIAVTAAVTTAIIAILTISFATLIFSGPLTVHLSSGVSLLLLGAVILALVTALTSSYAGSIASPQSATAAIAAIIAGSLSSQLADPQAHTGYVTVVAALTVSAFIVGLSMLALGWFRLGRLIRFIPYPVMGGFLAGTGWVLMVGSFGVMSSAQMSVSDLMLFANGDALNAWLPGLAFGGLLLFVVRRTSSFLALPVLMVGAVIAFYAFLSVSGMNVDMARQQGLIISDAIGTMRFQPLTPTDLTEVDWFLVASQLPTMLTMVVVAVLSLLLNATGVELVVERHLDLNMELRGSGLGNVITGLTGGVVGFQALSYTTLGHQLGARGRLTGIGTSIGIALVLLAGNDLISLLPRFLLGGVLAFLGLQLLVTWLVDTRHRITRAEYAVIGLIVLTTAALGYLAGVAIGLIAAIALFVIDYSQLSVIKNRLNGKEYQSKVVRSAAARQLLEAHGDQTQIIQLQGFIFFGTANSLVELVEDRLRDPELPPVRFLVLDFRRVVKIDSSAALSFMRLRQTLLTCNAVLLLTGISPAVEQRLDLSNNNSACDVLIFSELDRGAEWCENQLLATAEPQQAEFTDLLEQFRDNLGAEFALQMMRYLRRQAVNTGDVIARQGERGDEMFFIESGLLSVQLESESGVIRVRTATGGALLGEIGAYLHTPRTATIVVEQPGVIYRLSAANLNAMQQEHPVLSAAFNAMMTRLLAERLADTTATLRALLN